MSTIIINRYQFKKNLRRIISELYVRDNCHPFKASLLIWVQIPLWISVSLALRNLSINPGKYTCTVILLLVIINVRSRQHQHQKDRWIERESV